MAQIDQIRADRLEKNEKLNNAAGMEFISKYGVGVMGGLAGVLAANKFSPSFKALTLGPKAALVTMAGLFLGTYYGEKKVDRISSEQYEVRAKDYSIKHSHENSWTETFHNYKFAAVGTIWASSIAGSLLYSRSSYKLRLWERVLDARMFAQGATIAAIFGLIAAEVIIPRRKRDFFDDSN